MVRNRLAFGQALREYDDVLIRKLIAQIEVEKGARLEVRFRSGIVVRQGVEQEELQCVMNTGFMPISCKMQSCQSRRRRLS